MSTDSLAKEDETDQDISDKENEKEKRSKSTNTNTNTSESNNTFNISINNQDDKSKKDSKGAKNGKGIEDPYGDQEKAAWAGLISLKAAKRQFRRTRYPYQRIHKKIALQKRLINKSKRKAAILRELAKIELDQQDLNDDWFEFRR